ncbi:MAG: hypothetical protein K0U44_07930 [Actinomycetia bacterium]|nr:hypothetical protein [Actinomycetes bacterium]MCH9796516.1 hypothetical protein [Actinomycetes bacterium]MCH9850934.1 hypothetical protein [Actinomycetes bacterium]
MNLGTVMPMLEPVVVVAEEFTEQATVSEWPARLASVALVAGLIALALWGMRRGWQGRVARHASMAEPSAFDASGSSGVPGLYLGTSISGDWLDRVAVHELGVRSRASFHLVDGGVGIRRDGARSFLIPASAVSGVRTDRGVAGTVRGKDSVIVVTWMLGDDVLDTGIRADDGADHAALLDGLMAEYADNSEQVESSENPSSEGVHDSGAREVFDGVQGDAPLDGPGGGRE